MCGIFGAIGKVDKQKVATANNCLKHRGPDADGVWINQERSVALCHRRLAVVDLSEAGAQPMVSSSSRGVISYNGEIYNSEELRQNLPGQDWRGHSDTEVLLENFAAFGVRATIEKAVGMFAIAYWNEIEESLTLVRDRLGEKPLYYGYVGEEFLFSSELSAFEAYSADRLELNEEAMADVVKYSCVTGSKSIFKSVLKVPPGGILKITLDDIKNKKPPFVELYWDLRQVSKRNNGETEARLEELLKQAVLIQMNADVPLGAFLSGGIDSSLIVALMQSQSNRKVKTFTIGYEDKNYNEADHARAVAGHLGTEHTELILRPSDLLDEVENLANIYDEPFADSSQLPTILVSKLARKHVTVALSGDGGDELFAGYNRHIFLHDYWPKVERWPLFLRGHLAKLMEVVPANIWKSLLSGMSGRVALPHEKIFKLAKVLQAKSGNEIYSALIKFWYQDYPMLRSYKDIEFGKINSVDDMCVEDAKWYMPDDVLVKVDRAAMSQSLETRAPFLDHRVVEFAFSLPMSMNIENGRGKLLTRNILYKYVPKEILDRPKMGFSVPLDAWLRTDLRGWAEDLLNDQRLRKQKIFEPKIIQNKWREHLTGERNWHLDLWNVLMIQLWLKKHRGL